MMSTTDYLKDVKKAMENEVSADEIKTFVDGASDCMRKIIAGVRNGDYDFYTG